MCHHQWLCLCTVICTVLSLCHPYTLSCSHPDSLTLICAQPNFHPDLDPIMYHSYFFASTFNVTGKTLFNSKLASLHPCIQGTERPYFHLCPKLSSEWLISCFWDVYFMLSFPYVTVSPFILILSWWSGFLYDWENRSHKIKSSSLPVLMYRYCTFLLLTMDECLCTFLMMIPLFCAGSFLFSHS